MSSVAIVQERKVGYVASGRITGALWETEARSTQCKPMGSCPPLRMTATNLGFGSAAPYHAPSSSRRGMLYCFVRLYRRTAVSDPFPWCLSFHSMNSSSISLHTCSYSSSFSLFLLPPHLAQSVRPLLHTEF